MVETSDWVEELAGVLRKEETADRGRSSSCCPCRTCHSTGRENWCFEDVIPMELLESDAVGRATFSIVPPTPTTEAARTASAEGTSPSWTEHRGGVSISCRGVFL
jgi:hypothetical protein